jgi:uncharacterized protein
MAISDEKYVSTTTYRKSGTPVSTATWIVELDGGRVGFWTSSKSGKYKRLRNNPKVTLQPSDGRGKIKAGTAAVEGTAELATSGPQFDAIQSKVRSTASWCRCRGSSTPWGISASRSRTVTSQS